MNDSEDQKSLNNLITSIGCGAIAIIFILCLFCLFGCQYLPQVAQDLEEIETNDVIELKVSKEAIQKETDLQIGITIKNKDQSKL